MKQENPRTVRLWPEIEEAFDWQCKNVHKSNENATFCIFVARGLGFSEGDIEMFKEKYMRRRK